MLSRSVSLRSSLVFSGAHADHRFAALFDRQLRRCLSAKPSEFLWFPLSLGRFGLAAVYWLRDAIGYYGNSVAVSSLALAVVAFALAGLFFAKVVIERPSAPEAGLFITLMTLHPFNTEFFHFSDVTLNIMIGLLLSAIGACLASALRTGGFRLVLRWF